MPPTRSLHRIRVVEPVELLAGKVISYHARRNQPKSGSDWRDIAMLLLQFPELKAVHGAVENRLVDKGATDEVIAMWHDFAEKPVFHDDGEY